MDRRWLLVIFLFGCVFGGTDASEGDADPLYRYVCFFMENGPTSI